MIYAREGERIVSEDGRYLATVARDLDGSARGWSSDDFTDMQVDFFSAKERLPITSWLVKRILHTQERGFLDG